jgi:hypothetical protein
MEGNHLSINTKYEKQSGNAKKKRDLEVSLKEVTEELALERRERMNEVTEMDRKRIHATEKLKTDMLEKIRETKANLLALNDEQLQTVME